MTRTFWDSQYRFAEIIPGFAAFLERMAKESADSAPELAMQRRDYGAHPRQWVEWTATAGPSRRLVIFVHGGYWRALRAVDHRFLVPALAPFGAAVGNVEYRLMPEVRLADVVADATAGIRTLAAEFPQAELLLIGHSAGAHLALSALADAEIAARTRGVIALSGVYDLRPLALSFLQDELALTQAEVAEFSLGPADAGPAVVFVNGGAETHELLRGSAMMASRGRSAWRVLPDADHMSLLWASAACMSGLVEEIDALSSRG